MGAVAWVCMYCFLCFSRYEMNHPSILRTPLPRLRADCILSNSAVVVYKSLLHQNLVRLTKSLKHFINQQTMSPPYGTNPALPSIRTRRTSLRGTCYPRNERFNLATNNKDWAEQPSNQTRQTHLLDR